VKFVPADIPGIVIIEPKLFGDSRGFFMESWNKREFEKGGISASFVQDNHSRSVQGTLRGLHYQFKQPQGKLIRAISGDIFDVVVDIRKNSGTFGKSFSLILSGENRKMLWVPKGFAHGFYVLSETAEVVYKVTDYYAPEDEETIMWNDSSMSIDWPLVDGKSPILSVKDSSGRAFKEAKYFD